MSRKLLTDNSSRTQYVFLVFGGILLMFICSVLQQVELSRPGEYYYSGLLKNNYTVLAAIIFFITGLLIGYFLDLNPWYAGFCLMLVFPLVSLYEGTVYRGSHNLIPFEFIYFFLQALPAIAGIYVGKFLFRRKTKT